MVAKGKGQQESWRAPVWPPRLTSPQSRWAQRPRPVSSQEDVVTQSPHWRKGEAFGGKGLLEQLRKEDKGRQSR